MTEPPATPNPEEPGSDSGTNSPPAIDFSAFLRGNWVGAATVAGVALGAAFVVSLVVNLLSSIEDFDFVDFVASTFYGVGQAFGADIVYPLDDDVTASQGVFLSLGTVVALTLAVTTFRRVTANYDSWPTALGDAARVGLIASAVTTILAIILRIAEPKVQVREDSFLGALGVDGGQDSYLSIPGSIFLPFLLLFAVLAVSSFVTSTRLTGRMAEVQDWVAPALRGIGIVVLTLLVAGVFYAIGTLVEDSELRDAAGIASLLALLPGVGLHMVGLGVGAPYGLRSDFGSEEDEEMERLSGATDSLGDLFWISPIVALGVAVVGVLWVIRNSRDRSKVQRNVFVYVALLVVAVPFLVQWANWHVSYDSEDETGSFTVGIDGVQTTFFFALISLVIAVILLVATGTLDFANLKAKMSSLQSNPGQSQQQWGQQPPAGPSTTPPPADAPPPSMTPPPAGPPPTEPPPTTPPTTPPPSTPPPAGPPPTTPPTAPPDSPGSQP